MSDGKIEGSNGSLCDEGGGGTVVIISYQPPTTTTSLITHQILTSKTLGISTRSTGDLDPARTIS